MFQLDAGVADVQGADPVSNHQSGAAHHQPLHGLHDTCLSGHVHRTGGVIQDEYGSVFQECPGQRYPLALSPRKHHAPLSHRRVVLIRQSGDELVAVGCPCRLNYLGEFRSGMPIADILGDARRE